jgi:hypothetical protein
MLHYPLTADVHVIKDVFEFLLPITVPGLLVPRLMKGRLFTLVLIAMNFKLYRFRDIQFKPLDA